MMRRRHKGRAIRRDQPGSIRHRPCTPSSRNHPQGGVGRTSLALGRARTVVAPRSCTQATRRAHVVLRARLGWHRHHGTTSDLERGAPVTPNDGSMLARPPRGGQGMGEHTGIVPSELWKNSSSTSSL
ncbi:hypothetical protein PIB30_070840 [Stylosanthes scabra]|uniref:Uncharacterized protein n=1 Tax=Stylosanthes scabra TaxID=79078 RepID=A0ABU6QN67_9FABA|nr:hypothetical protein [Stylosanthes scabra]